MEPPDEDEEPTVGTSEGKVTFVLEEAPVELGKVGKSMTILNSDEHAEFLKKHGKDPAQYRPDIAHQTLLAVLDSPLNKAGYVEAIFMKTTGNALVSISPNTRLPRTFKRFCGLMVQALQKLSVRASNGPDKLMRCVKQPVTRHLPVGSRRIATSVHCSQVKHPKDIVESSSLDQHLCFVVGAMAHGSIESSYCDEWWSISKYSLSAACCIGRICSGLELYYDIL